MTTFDGRRSDYDRGALTKADLAADPIAQLIVWLDEAAAAGVIEHAAMSVSTVDAEGRPSSRVVLLRGIVDDGLVFFTSYDSAKARDLSARADCAALLSWLELQRQVRVTGRAERLDETASDEYFASRPRGSQIGVTYQVSRGNGTNPEPPENVSAKIRPSHGPHLARHWPVENDA